MSKEEIQAAFNESKAFGEDLSNQEDLLKKMFDEFYKTYPADVEYINVLSDLRNMKDIDDEINRCTIANNICLLKKKLLSEEAIENKNLVDLLHSAIKQILSEYVIVQIIENHIVNY